MEEQSTYEGEWKDGKRNCFGILCWGNQSKFMGNFYENKVLDYGKLWHDGDAYKGILKEYQEEGLGFYQTKKGAFLKGNWSHDRQNGFGLEKWSRDNIFIGEYVCGNKDDIGIFHFEDKAGYEGEFKDGIISGVGTFYFWDDRKYQGEWVNNNKMHGYGFIIWPDGNFFEGEFYEDKKHGFGVFYNNNKVFISMWKNNKLYGNVLVIDNGNCKKKHWENGKPVRVLEENYQIYFENFFEELIVKKKIGKKD